ncbi:hypothetical protein [Roseateles terrae]|uniref:DUF3618 domain-containing protein n=1 Tax=Roseateles terrae TaxID=431060 RepID=A0ABR6GLY1_9BURK|nr:hypothetical protein [Roseateles terrae]MBB3192721.1 hypothetical protein [Roseateles terrae]OWQ89998.1 hypothetical protein CDN98_05810 [Roseateles terrae]
MAAPQPPAPDTLEELNARIDLIELRVVRRDMEFRHHSQSLKARGQALMAPSHWLRPVLGVGSGWLFWRLLRRRPRRHGHRDEASARRPPLGAGLLSGLLGSVLGAKAAEAATPDAGPRGAATGAHGAAGHDGKVRPELGMLQMLTMAWGFMPARIRGSLGPDTTQLLLGLVAGLMQGMQQKRKARSHAATPATPTPATEGPGPSVKADAPVPPGVRAGL